MHALPDGKRLEVIYRKADGGGSRPPLVFIHGSYHAAWCWEEHFMPFFSERGYDCYALSLRAQGGSDPIEGNVAGTVQSLAEDIASFVGSLDRPPVVIGHSFGGLPVQWLVAAGGAPPIAGVAFLASVPQSGNKDIVGRFLVRTPVLAMKITWWFIRKSFGESEEACRTCFFSPELPDEVLRRYMNEFKNSSPTRLIDLKAMNEIIPLPAPPSDGPPAIVVGAKQDKIVDSEAVFELARHWRVEPVVLDGVAHDVMLDTKWEVAATAVAAWLKETYPA